MSREEMSSPAATPTPLPRGRGLGWPIAMTLVLATTVGVNLFVYRIAASDPSVAVEPDYYNKAVHWDDELAQRRLNRELGWRSAITLSAGNGMGGAGELSVRLTDSTGAPLEGATVSAQAFPVARANQVAALELVASAGDADDGSQGIYAAPLAVTRRGRWEVRLAVTHDGDRFTSTQQVELPFDDDRSTGSAGAELPR